MPLARKAQNAMRGLLQAYGTPAVKKRLWNLEFANGRWDCLDRTDGDCVYPFVARYANRGAILDLGCGSGSTANELDRSAYESYTGVDISDVALEKAARRSRENGRADAHRFVAGDIFSYVPTGTFDVILFRDSIYYVPRAKIAAMLTRYARFLKPTGAFVVRMLSVNGKYQPIVDTIHANFDVLETHTSDRQNAVVIAFR